MPVRLAGSIDRAEPQATLRIDGTDLLPTLVPLPNPQIDAVAPVLVLRAPILQMKWTAGDGPPRLIRSPLHALAEDQRLVGITTNNLDFARQLFPNQRLIAITLDAADPLPGPPAAWETLDALILDSPSSLRSDHIAEYLAGGMTLAVRASSPPDHRWPWGQRGEYFVLQPDLAGPTSAIFNEDAYRPTYAWPGGWPASFRRRLVLAAVLFSVIVLLLAIWRRGWIAAILLCLLMIPALAWWRSAQSPLLHVGGAIEVHSPDFTQTDDWSYQSSLDPIDSGFAWRMSASTHPIFATPSHAQTISMSLRCDPRGQPQFFDYHLPANLRLAFLTRSISPAPTPPRANLPLTSPLRSLADSLYATPRTRLLGQLPADDAWPTILIEQSPHAEE